MNLVNRLIVIVELLLGILIVPISIVLMLFFLPGVASVVNSVARGLTNGATSFLIQMICVVTALLVFFIAIILLYMEMSRPRVGRIQVQVEGGQVEITEEAVTQRLEHSIEQIADIVLVKPHVVASKDNAVDALLELETAPTVNVPQKTQEVIAIAKQVMEQQMGLKVGKVRVQLNYSRKQVKSQGA